MASKTTEKAVLGSLMRDPLLLSQVEKYNLSVDDFDDKLMQHAFYALANIAQDGSTLVKTQDIHLFLQSSPTGLGIFEKNNGIAVLNDAFELANSASFGSYYSLMKKENLLRDLKKQGFDTREFYDVNPITNEAIKINEKYSSLEPKDIIQTIKTKVMGVEKSYVQDSTTTTTRAGDNIDEFLAELEEDLDIGPAMQGDIFNTISAGARRGCLYIRSGGSGVSKTRQAVGDACFLAYPIRYNETTCKWEQTGQNEKVLFIATEQTDKEIKRMILAYLTGFNETKFRHNKFTDAERKIVQQAAYVMKKYVANMLVTRMPNPSIEITKSIIRENVIMHDVEYVFFDYIFICPSLLYEFKGIGNLRNDEILLMFSTALKDLAVENNIFVMTSTQVSAKADDNKDIRNEGSIAGARAIINKADLGLIMARPTTEELKVLDDIIKEANIPTPNIVTDVYKVRAGEWNQCKIWSYADLGCMRKVDLFVTDGRLNQLADFHNEYFEINSNIFEVVGQDLKELNGLQTLKKDEKVKIDTSF